MSRKFLLLAAVAVVASLVAPATSQAQFTLTLSTGSDSVSIQIISSSDIVATSNTIQGLSGGVNIASGGYTSADGKFAYSGGILISDADDATITGLTLDKFVFASNVASSNAPGANPANISLTNSKITNNTSGTGSFSSTIALRPVWFITVA